MAKKEKIIKIVGRIVNRANGNGLVGLRVEAWDKDLICDDLVGSAVTDAQGAFQMEFDASYFQEALLDRQPDLFFKVFQDGGLIHSTEDSVLWNVEAGATEMVIEVEASQEPPLEVKGAVRLSDGSPAGGSYGVRLRPRFALRAMLGQSQTDNKGFYQIQYFARQFRKREKGSADLVVKAFAAEARCWSPRRCCSTRRRSRKWI